MGVEGRCGRVGGGGGREGGGGGTGDAAHHPAAQESFRDAFDDDYVVTFLPPTPDAQLVGADGAKLAHNHKRRGPFTTYLRDSIRQHVNVKASGHGHS